METLGVFLDACVDRDPAREAVAYAPSARVAARLTLGELRAASRLAAKKLLSAGAGKGTRTGFLCSNRIEWLPFAFGALRIGAILVPFSTLWKRDEIAYGLLHADVQVFVLMPSFLRHDYVERLLEIVPELRAQPRGTLRSAAAPNLRRVLTLGGESHGLERWDDLPADVDDAFLDALERSVVPSDPATVFFTSGTTARAKAVVHAHAALTTSARRIAEWIGITADDAWWGHMPLFWSGGFILGALATLAGGGRIVLQEIVDAGAALELLESERCTIMAGWHQAGALLDHPDFPRRRLFLKKGTYHPLAPRLMGANHRTIGVYGMSETATFAAAAKSTDSEAVRSGTFGRPLPGMELRIVDPETRRPLPPGEIGEIIVKGVTLMEGYCKMPRASTFDDDGFFSTGDRGYLDADGNLHFAGRLKDVIKTAGVNVAAAEIEEALARHPAVKTAHVTGVPDPVRGENIAAFVVAEAGEAVHPEELLRFCRDSLASYKVPRYLFIVADAELPRTGSGKIEKSALQRAAMERLASGPGT